MPTTGYTRSSIRPIFPFFLSPSLSLSASSSFFLLVPSPSLLYLFLPSFSFHLVTLARVLLLIFAPSFISFPRFFACTFILTLYFSLALVYTRALRLFYTLRVCHSVSHFRRRRSRRVTDILGIISYSVGWVPACVCACVSSTMKSPSKRRKRKRNQTKSEKIESYLKL